MTGVYVMLGSIILFAVIITALDPLADHRRSKAHRH